MKIICIENNHSNGNFTVNEKYSIQTNRDGYFGDYVITCNFVHVFADKDTIGIIEKKNIGDTFNFALCKFEVIGK